MPMSDNPAVQATQPLVAQIVSGYVRKNQVALADIATVINAVYQSLMSLGKAPEPIPQASAVSFGNPFARHTWCAWNAEYEGRCYADISGGRMVWKPMSIEPSGGFRRITQSLLRVIPRHDPHSQSRLGWDGEQGGDGDGALETDGPQPGGSSQ